MKASNLDGIVIETSGLALPRPLIQALGWPSIRSRVYINGVVTLIDGEALSLGSPVGDIAALERQRNEDESLDHLTPIDELFSDQIQVADLILVSRADKLTYDSLAKLKTNISDKLDSKTSILFISNGEIDPEIILGIDNTKSINLHNSDQIHSHKHVRVFNETVRLEDNIEKSSIEKILSEIASEYQILRLKGRCWIPSKIIPLQIQMVGPRFNSWFEKTSEQTWRPRSGGLDLVVLSLKKGAAQAIINAFSQK